MTKATHAHFHITHAPETLFLSERCDVAMFINKLVSELLFHDGKQLKMIA